MTEQSTSHYERCDDLRDITFVEYAHPTRRRNFFNIDVPNRRGSRVRLLLLRYGRFDPAESRRHQKMTSEPESTEPVPAADGVPADPSALPTQTEHKRHPAVVATAIALPVALLVGVIVAAIAISGKSTRTPEALSAVEAPAADSPNCASLLDALPQSLGDFDAAELAAPAPVGARAWAPQNDTSDAVVLRCGLSRPDAFDVAAPLQVINGVQWFEVSGADAGIAASTWFAVDRPVYIALTVPTGSGPTPLQDASDAIFDSLEQTPLDPAPLR